MKFVAFYDIVIGMAISTADFFRAISVAEDIKMGFAIAIAMAAVCQAMSHWRLHPEEWRHPDEHDKLSLFDDMGIGMAIQRIKMSFFLSSNLCYWRHQDDHRLFDDVYFVSMSFVSFLKVCGMCTYIGITTPVFDAKCVVEYFKMVMMSFVFSNHMVHDLESFTKSWREKIISEPELMKAVFIFLNIFVDCTIFYSIHML